MAQYIVLIHDNEWQTSSSHPVSASSATAALKQVLNKDEEDVKEITRALMPGTISGGGRTWLTVDLDDTRTFHVILLG